MSRAGFRFQRRLRRSLRAWPHGVADSWGSAPLHPAIAHRRWDKCKVGEASSLCAL
jgi:hypothetical protein